MESGREPGVRASGSRVARRSLRLSVIYLDNNATTRPSAAVIEAMRRALEELWLDKLKPFGDRGYNPEPKCAA